MKRPINEMLNSLNNQFAKCPNGKITGFNKLYINHKSPCYRALTVCKSQVIFNKGNEGNLSHHNRPAHKGKKSRAILRYGHLPTGHFVTWTFWNWIIRCGHFASKPVKLIIIAGLPKFGSKHDLKIREQDLKEFSKALLRILFIFICTLAEYNFSKNNLKKN